MKLLNRQIDSEDITENKYTGEKSNVPDKLQDRFEQNGYIVF
jgi:hypothetical protein